MDHIERLKEIARPVKDIVRALRQRGLGYIGYLVTGYLLPQIAYLVLCRLKYRRAWLAGLTLSALLVLGFARPEWVWPASLILVLLGCGALVARLAIGRREMARLQRDARARTPSLQASYPPDTFTAWGRFPVDPATRAAVAATQDGRPAGEIVLGHIDQRGRVLGVMGAIPGWEPVAESEFVERNRDRLDIVLLDDLVLVRKDFRGHRGRFIHEWYNLVRLTGRAHVPAIYQVDETNCRLYLQLILGRTLDRVPAGSECWEAIEEQLDAIHACGVAHLSLTPGDILVQDQSDIPWFLDFGPARAYPTTTSMSFILARDQDRVAFNQLYHRALLTERSARAALAAHKSWPIPVDFGHGLTAGSFWTVARGTGRWEYLNKHAMPALAGKRVLDLGSNNGVMAMQLLRAGAREVIGLDLLASHIERARLVQRIYEWRDMRRYALHLYNCNMLELLQRDWGTFDIVTALCSLYYLEPSDMARMVRKIAELAPILVLQANVGHDISLPNRSKKRASFLKHVLEENGFPHITIVAPAHYSRPLLIGRTTEPAQQQIAAGPHTQTAAVAL
jgi:SAM-dependent methyltransferase